MAPVPENNSKERFDCIPDTTKKKNLLNLLRNLRDIEFGVMGTLNIVLMDDNVIRR